MIFTHPSFIAYRHLTFAVSACSILAAACTGNIGAERTTDARVDEAAAATAGWCARFDLDDDGCLGDDEFDFQRERFDERCSDGSDHWCNELDGLNDCYDYQGECTPAAECASDIEHSDAPSSCADECDNDADGNVDCRDADCAHAPNCVEHSDQPESCDDGEDNDLDGLTDCREADCASAPACRDDDGSGDDDDAGDDDDSGDDDEPKPPACQYYRDLDGDGYGDGRAAMPCDDLRNEPPLGWAKWPGDCNDADADVNPSTAEICDGIDNDCDGRSDDAPYCLCKQSDEQCMVQEHGNASSRSSPSHLRVLWVTGFERDEQNECYSRKPYAIINEWFHNSAGGVTYDPRFTTCDEIPLCSDVANLACR